MTENMKQYEVCCYCCGSVADITMVAHRCKNNESIVGWLFVCTKCYPKLSGRHLTVKIEEENYKIRKMEENLGYVFGEICNREGCKGVIDEYDRETECSCHINPPCASCTANRGYCPECGWEAEN